jgi:hypothetical protein
MSTYHFNSLVQKNSYRWWPTMATLVCCHLNSAADHTVYLIPPELTTKSITFKWPGSMLLVIHFIYLGNKKNYSIFEDKMHNLCSIFHKMAFI